MTVYCTTMECVGLFGPLTVTVTADVPTGVRYFTPLMDVVHPVSASEPPSAAQASITPSNTRPKARSAAEAGKPTDADEHQRPCHRGARSAGGAPGPGDSARIVQRRDVRPESDGDGDGLLPVALRIGDGSDGKRARRAEGAGRVRPAGRSRRR